MTNIARAEDFQANVEVFLSPGDPRHRGGIAAMVPFRKNNDSMSFVDGRFWLDDNTASEYNLAFGHRWFNSNRSSIFGLFGAFDHRKSSTDRDHNQLTAGAEMLMDDWELRGNYYYPLSDRYLVGVGGTNGSFSGNKLYANGIFEEALEGLDIEAGRSFALHGIGLDENWIHIGGYHFEGDAAGDVDGVSLRLTSFLRKNLSIGLAAQDDDLFGSEIRGEIRYSFGRASGGGKRTLSERMMQLVHRDIDVKTTAGVPDHLRTDLNSTVDVSPGAGVIHIDSSSEESTEDGSYEYPYKTIANCKAAECGTEDGAMIYVHEGDSDEDGGAYDTGTGWTLRDNQQLIGEGFDLYGIGGEGDYPEITTAYGDDLTLVTLADGNEVAGIEFNSDFEYGGTTALYAEDVGTFNIHDNRFLDLNVEGSEGYYGAGIGTARLSGGTTRGVIDNNQFFEVMYPVTVLSNDASESTQNLTISNNRFMDFDQAITVHNYADDAGSVTQNLLISDNSFVSDASSDPAIYAYNMANAYDSNEGGSAIQNFTLTGNILTTEGDGIYAYNYAYAEGDYGAFADQEFTIADNDFLAVDDDTGRFYNYAFGYDNTNASKATANQTIDINDLELNMTDGSGAAFYAYNYAYTNGADGSVANATSDLSVVDSNFHEMQSSGAFYIYNIARDENSADGGTPTATQTIEFNNFYLGIAQEDLAYVYNYAYGEDALALQMVDMADVEFVYVYDEVVTLSNHAVDATATQLVTIDQLRGYTSDYDIVRGYNYAHSYDADTLATQSIDATGLEEHYVENDEGAIFYNYSYAHGDNSATATSTNTLEDIYLITEDDVLDFYNYAWTGDYGSGTSTATQTNIVTDGYLNNTDTSDAGIMATNAARADYGSGNAFATQNNTFTDLDIYNEGNPGIVYIYNYAGVNENAYGNAVANQTNNGSDLYMRSEDNDGLYLYNWARDNAYGAGGDATATMNSTFDNLDIVTEEESVYIYNRAEGDNAYGSMSFDISNVEATTDEEALIIRNTASYGGTANMSDSTIEGFVSHGSEYEGIYIYNDTEDSAYGSGSMATMDIDLTNITVTGAGDQGIYIVNASTNPDTAYGSTADQTVTLTNVELAGAHDEGLYIYNFAEGGGVALQNVSADGLISRHNAEEGVYIYNRVDSYNYNTYSDVGTYGVQTVTLENTLITDNAGGGLVAQSYGNGSDATAEQTINLVEGDILFNGAPGGAYFSNITYDGSTSTQTVDLTDTNIEDNYDDVVLDESSDTEQTVTLPDGTIVTNVP
ncbi:hypothetical protein BOW53_08695 [Solemya pervernicosa gill symbiont]|uniref:Inverse autotransporter beta-domain domain-containing protein n=2 Tax=Solemya pervernicosa gill symbiont TaxID=642797 RepID=A0A1T2L523_9GAMM|nr:hypothetical protein BOW53_08695 [Solemya pervernicosa gill symbiont]